MTRRAIVFDLDETLYRERRFALGGYRAVARSIATNFDLSEARVFAFLAQALRHGRRPRAFQDLCLHHGLPASCIPVWIEIFRGHEPRLRLPRVVRQTLDELRAAWRVGILTNGLPSVQASKVEALGIDRLVDVVVYADGFGGGKPSPAAFREVLDRLDAEPARSVFAGDDPIRDIAGARRVGMWTVLLERGPMDVAGCREGVADAIVHSLGEIPAVAERLVHEEGLHVH